MNNAQPKLKPYALTVSPKHDIIDPVVSDVARVIADISDQHAVVCETSGKRHLHAFILLKQPKTTSNAGKWFKKHIGRILQEHDQEHAPSAIFVKPCYNDDWVTQYLTKDADVEVISQDMPDPDTRTAAYAEVPDKRKKSIQYNSSLVRLAADFCRAHPLMPPRCVDHKRVEKWYLQLCYAQRAPYIEDPRRFNRKMIAICAFIRKDEEYNYSPHLPGIDPLV